jgi:YbgC/YbaW family acyl-CoA thioester hydrolase
MNPAASFHFRHRRMVEFADTDVAGIMHFSNFFRFVESAEHAFFRSLGFRVHSAGAVEHEGWPRLEVSCRFHKPAQFEQTLETCLFVEEMRTSSLRYRFAIFPAEPADPAPLATGSCAIIHVALDSGTRAIRKTPIPEPLRRSLEAAMAAPFSRS